MRKLIIPLSLLAIFWTLGLALWQGKGQIFYLVNFGYIGTALGVGMGLHQALPRARKPLGRQVALFLVGGYMFGLLGLAGRENMQLEGFFWYLLAGFWAGAVIHYLVAKVVGPLLWGRAWCAWACWTAMILDLLPWSGSPGRVAGRWGLLRYLHFGLSLGLVAGLWYGFGFRVDLAHRRMDLLWLLSGNACYYLAGVGLALALRDNRAFCKYLCPITAILKATARFSVLKIEGKRVACDGCGACVRACPMDIRIPEYVQEGKRVLSTECIYCETCVNACPRQALGGTFRFDLGGKERLRERRPPGVNH